MSTTLPRRGLAPVGARARPAYQKSISRNRGTTWAYPGFGRDPDLTPTPVLAGPPAVTPPPPATTPQSEGENQQAPDPTLLAGPPASGGPSAGDGFSVAQDFAQNPEAYSNTALEGLLGNLSLSDLVSPSAIGSALGGLVAGPPGALAGGLLGWGYSQFAGPQGPTQADGFANEVAENTSTIGEQGGNKADPGGAAIGGPENAEGGVMGGVDGGSKSNTASSPGGFSEGENETGFGGVDFGGENAEGSATGGQDGGDKGDPGAEGGGTGDQGGGGTGGDGGMGADGSDGPGGDGDGWMVGGYTGAGPDGVVQPDQPAGTVHEGEVVIPAQQVQQHGVEPLMALAGPGAKMGQPPMPGRGALGGIQAGGMGMGMGAAFAGDMDRAPADPPTEDATVPPFQTAAGGEMAEGGEDEMGEGEDYELVGGDDSDDSGGGGFQPMGPYRNEAQGNDPFRAASPSQGVTGGQALQALAHLPPDAQAMVLQALGSDPMVASALLQVLGPTFQPMISTALKAGAAAAQQQQMAMQQQGGGMGAPPPGGPPMAGGGGGGAPPARPGMMG